MIQIDLIKQANLLKQQVTLVRATFGVLLILGIIGSSYYLIKLKNTKPQTMQTAQAPITNQIANWQTYTNTKDGYSIQYPPQVLVDEAGHFNLKIQGDNYLIDILSSTTPGTNLYDLKPTTIAQVVTNECPNLGNPESCSASWSGPILGSIQFDVINSHYASTDTVFQHGNVIYVASLGINNPNMPVSTEAKDIYNQILNTLKFTNSDNTPEKTTENFYKWYIGCLNQTVGQSNPSQCDYKSGVYVSSDLAKNIQESPVCAVNIPKYGSVDQAVITGVDAQTTVHTIFGSGDNPITVKLRLIDNQWKIVNIICVSRPQ